ncbi:hypothetical protein DRN73_08050, partial [Candidatus Pacearchaeota archaeon]
MSNETIVKDVYLTMKDAESYHINESTGAVTFYLPHAEENVYSLGCKSINIQSSTKIFDKFHKYIHFHYYYKTSVPNIANSSSILNPNATYTQAHYFHWYYKLDLETLFSGGGVSGNMTLHSMVEKINQKIWEDNVLKYALFSDHSNNNNINEDTSSFLLSEDSPIIDGSIKPCNGYGITVDDPNVSKIVCHGEINAILPIFYIVDDMINISLTSLPLAAPADPQARIKYGLLDQFPNLMTYLDLYKMHTGVDDGNSIGLPDAKDDLQKFFKIGYKIFDFNVGFEDDAYKIFGFDFSHFSLRNAPLENNFFDLVHNAVDPTSPNGNKRIRYHICAQNDWKYAEGDDNRDKYQQMLEGVGKIYWTNQDYTKIRAVNCADDYGDAGNVEAVSAQVHPNFNFVLGGYKGYQLWHGLKNIYLIINDPIVNTEQVTSSNEFILNSKKVLRVLLV